MKHLAFFLATFLLAGPAQAQPEVEELLDEVRALSRGLGLSGAGSGDLEAMVQAEIAAVERESGMSATGPIATRVVTREEAHAHVAGLVAEQLPPERLADLERGWKALGLLAPDVALGPTIEALYAGQAGGFYDPKTRSMVLLGDMPSLFQVPVVRHELVHALQDQTYGLTQWLGDAGEDEDRAAAVQAVLEGHATDVMNRVTLQSLGLGGALSPELEAELGDLLGSDVSADELLAPALDASSLGAFLPSDVPPVLRVQLLFPYVVGATFVAGYREAHPEDPGCKGLYARPPRSSAEVLDPRLWASGTFAPDFTNPGIGVPGWRTGWTSALGRLISWVLLSGRADPSAGDPWGGRWDVAGRDADVVLGSGWRGDRVAVLHPSPKTPGTPAPGGHLVAWVARWRDASEAAEVASALKKRLPSAEIEALGDRTHVLVASSGTAPKSAWGAIRAWK